jgi:hypothetical protein
VSAHTYNPTTTITYTRVVRVSNNFALPYTVGLANALFCTRARARCVCVRSHRHNQTHLSLSDRLRHNTCRLAISSRRTRCARRTHGARCCCGPWWQLRRARDHTHAPHAVTRTDTGTTADAASARFGLGGDTGVVDAGFAAVGAGLHCDNEHRAHESRYKHTFKHQQQLQNTHSTTPSRHTTDRHLWGGISPAAQSSVRCPLASV